MVTIPTEQTPEFKELTDAVARGSVIPFVGAGLSYDYGYRMWGQFLTDVSAGMEIADAVSAALNRGAYEEAADIVDCGLVANGTSGGIGDKVKEVFGRKVEHPEKVTSASLLPRLTSGPIITTNFDRVLEEVYARVGNPLFALWGSKARLALEAPSPHLPLLLKIHGDAKHQEDRVLLLAEYERHYGTGSALRFDGNLPLPALLKRIFLSGSVLFLGCSLSEDRTMSVLASLANQSPHKHFAFVAAEASMAAQNVRTASLASRGITPIYYERNNHGEVKRLLEILVASKTPMPSAPGGTFQTDRMKEFATLEAAKNHAGALLRNHLQIPAGTEDGWRSYLDIKDQVDLFLPATDAIAFHRLIADAFEQSDGERTITALIGAFGLADRAGDRETARHILASAVRIEAPKKSVVSVLQVLHALAGQAASDGDLRSAARHSISALRLADKSWSEPSVGLVAMLSRFARTLFKLGRKDRARRFLARALYLVYVGDFVDEVALLMNFQAGWWLDRDQPKRADALARLGLVYARSEAFGIKATLHADIGTAQIWMQNFDGALDALWRAWWYERIATNVDWHEIVTHIENMAWLHWRTFQKWEHSTDSGATSSRNVALEWSIDMYDQAIQIGEAENLNERYGLAVQQALPLAASGKVLEALKQLRKALIVLRRENLPWTATGLNNCGLIWDRLGDKSRARFWYRRALRRVIDDDDVVLRPTVESNLRSIDAA